MKYKFFFFMLIILFLFTHQVSAKEYKFQIYTINQYDQIGGTADDNLSVCHSEGVWFLLGMSYFGNSFGGWVMDGDVSWKDWATSVARVNEANFAYFAGHGNPDGPDYGDRAYNGSTYMMVPDRYKFGALGKLKWIVWSACSTLYDGVQDSSYINWGNEPFPLKRWFQSFQGLHSLLGFRSVSTEGFFTKWDPGFAPWNWFDTYSYESGVMAYHFVLFMYSGMSISDAWFLATDLNIYCMLGAGFEAAAMNPHIGDWDSGLNYHGETITSPYPDYSVPVTGFWYSWHRQGTPKY